MKRILLCSIVVFLSLSQFVFSAVEVNIRYYNKTMYYPGNTENNPMYILVEVRNSGPDTFRFKLADDRMFSLDFTIRTVRNSELPQTNMLVRKRTTSNTVYFREIVLESGESYSFVENLKEYIEINDPSIYYLNMQFYPELYKTKTNAIDSNRLTLEVRPAPTVAASTTLPIDTDSMTVLVPEAISPDRVVEQTILARQRGHWDNYFLYMDIEQMLIKDPVRNRQYRSSSASERDRMLANYKADLMQTRIDRDIVAIPARFSMERTVYSQTEGTVTVLEWFPFSTFTEKKRYTYYVRQRDGIWQIYDFTVENLGTE